MTNIIDSIFSFINSYFAQYGTTPLTILLTALFLTLCFSIVYNIVRRIINTILNKVESKDKGIFFSVDSAKKINDKMRENASLYSIANGASDSVSLGVTALKKRDTHVTEGFTYSARGISKVSGWFGRAAYIDSNKIKIDSTHIYKANFKIAFFYNQDVNRFLYFILAYVAFIFALFSLISVYPTPYGVASFSIFAICLRILPATIKSIIDRRNGRKIFIDLGILQKEDFKKTKKYDIINTLQVFFSYKKVFCLMVFLLLLSYL